MNKTQSNNSNIQSQDTFNKEIQSFFTSFNELSTNIHSCYEQIIFNQKILLKMLDYTGKLYLNTVLNHSQMA